MDTPPNVTPLRAVPRSLNIRTLTLSMEQIGVVLAALQELPYKHVAPLVHTIIQQANAAPAEPDAPAEPQPNVG
jgi:hypothetical protein